jgi:hypothetical protein
MARFLEVIFGDRFLWPALVFSEIEFCRFRLTGPPHWNFMFSKITLNIAPGGNDWEVAANAGAWPR